MSLDVDLQGSVSEVGTVDRIDPDRRQRGSEALDSGDVGSLPEALEAVRGIIVV